MRLNILLDILRSAEGWHFVIAQRLLSQIAPPGQTIISGSDDRTIKFWRIF